MTMSSIKYNKYHIGIVHFNITLETGSVIPMHRKIRLQCIGRVNSYFRVVNYWLSLINGVAKRTIKETLLHPFFFPIVTHCLW
jgi:hypothetical protein